MPREIGRYHRPPAARQIGRRCNSHPPCCADAARNERRIGQIADTNGKVQPRLDQIDEPVAHRQFHVDLWIAIEKRGHARRDMQSPERDRGAEAEQPGRQASPPAHARFRFRDRLQRARRKAVELPPIIRQRHGTARPVEQAHAQVRLERGDCAADRWLRAALVAGDRAEPAGLRHAREQFHAGEYVHAVLINTSDV